MRRRTNLALAVLLVSAVITVASQAIGVDWPLDPAAIHGAVALAILVLSPWKTTVVRRGFSVRDLETTWPVTRVGGEPLSRGHGFPARIVPPARRGFLGEVGHRDRPLAGSLVGAVALPAHLSRSPLLVAFSSVPQAR